MASSTLFHKIFNGFHEPFPVYLVYDVPQYLPLHPYNIPTINLCSQDEQNFQ